MIRERIVGKKKKKERFLYSNRSNVWSLYLEQSFVWGVLDLLEYRSASSCVRCMCPQLACCLLRARWDQMRLFDADLALAVIHSFQPSFCPFYSTLGSALSLDLYSPKFLSFFFFYQFAYSLLSFALPFMPTYIWYPPQKSHVPLCQQEFEGNWKRTQKSLRVR